MGQNVSLTAKDGHSLDAYVGQPSGAAKGGLIVIQEIFGVNAHVRRLVDYFAGQGYLAIAPALFDRVEKGIEVGYDEKGFAIQVNLQLQSAALSRAATDRSPVFSVGGDEANGAVGDQLAKRAVPDVGEGAQHKRQVRSRSPFDLEEPVPIGPVGRGSLLVIDEMNVDGAAFVGFPPQG